MHIHRWTKWEDTIVVTVPLPLKPDIKHTVSAQTRVCAKCNKRRTRKMKVE